MQSPHYLCHFRFRDGIADDLIRLRLC